MNQFLLCRWIEDHIFFYLFSVLLKRETMTRAPVEGVSFKMSIFHIVNVKIYKSPVSKFQIQCQNVNFPKFQCQNVTILKSQCQNLKPNVRMSKFHMANVKCQHFVYQGPNDYKNLVLLFSKPHHKQHLHITGVLLLLYGLQYICHPELFIIVKHSFPTPLFWYWNTPFFM